MMNRTQLVDYLAATPLLGSLEFAQLEEIAGEAEYVRLAGGETLVEQGEPGDCLYVVLYGRLRASVRQPTGEETRIGEVGRGETVGEMALLTGEPRSATVRAIRDSGLARFSKAACDRLVEQSPRTVLRLAQLIVTRLQRLIQAPLNVPGVSTVAVVPAGRASPFADVARALVRALSPFGSTLHLNADNLDDLLAPHASRAPSDSSESAVIAQWLNEQEMRHQFIVYEADPEPSPWTRRCLRQADIALLVAAAESSTALNELETEVFRVPPAPTAPRRHLVLVHAAGDPAPAGTPAWRLPRHVDGVHHLRLGAADDSERLARLLIRRGIGLVLGGGGARAFSHIGVIRALQDASLPIDAIAGTSMGGLVAAMYAQGWDADTMLRVSRKEWVERRPMRDYAIPFMSLMTCRKVTQMLQRTFGDRHIEDLWLPYFCTTSNLTRAEATVHNTGPVWKCVGASMAVPGMAHPIYVNGDMHLDGGVMNNLPADVMRDARGGTVIAVDVTGRYDAAFTPKHDDCPTANQILLSRVFPWRSRLEVPSIFDILVRTMLLGSARSMNAMRRDVDLYLQPPVQRFGMFEWKSIDEIVDIGFNFASEEIAKWKRSLGRSENATVATSRPQYRVDGPLPESRGDAAKVGRRKIDVSLPENRADTAYRR
jgi:predicted acylesterase/phospholipase RssA/CRP-like cAMP-binding protein